MRAEILCVGSELLLGQIIDTNAAYIATQLARAGVDVLRKQTAGDNLERIIDCIRGALSRADAVIITGGLGPTSDDLTREAIAKALGVELELHPELESELRAFFAQRDMVPKETTMRQAYLPQGAQAIHNPVGTAPGVRADTAQNQMIFAVPGVPREMRAMMDESVIPALTERISGERNVIVSRTLRAFGIGESTLAEPLEDILTTATNPTVAPLIYQNTEVHLRLTAKARDDDAAKILLDEMEATIRARSGEHIFGTDEQTLPAIVVELLRERGQTVAVAESVTGGLLHSLLTDIPGASKVLAGGVVAYAVPLKEKLLNVSPATLETHGVVSEAVAAEMAQGVQQIGNADFGLSTTGEAGPESASGTLTGTVCFGLCDATQNHDAASILTKISATTFTTTRQYFGDREAVKKRAALCALDLLRRHLLDEK